MLITGYHQFYEKGIGEFVIRYDKCLKLTSNARPIGNGPRNFEPRTDRDSEKACPVFELLVSQTMSAEVWKYEWNSYPAAREMDLPGNIAVELGEQRYPECPHIFKSSCFQTKELRHLG
ncbi:hypothetical protein TNCV_2929541 [Trichonephila clavipes]|nr:hypothetical protein TNCV_2929541 [Trichonephila clavipes]